MRLCAGSRTSARSGERLQHMSCTAYDVLPSSGSNSGAAPRTGCTGGSSEANARNAESEGPVFRECLTSVIADPTTRRPTAASHLSLEIRLFVFCPAASRAAAPAGSSRRSCGKETPLWTPSSRPAPAAGNRSLPEHKEVLVSTAPARLDLSHTKNVWVNSWTAKDLSLITFKDFLQKAACCCFDRKPVEQWLKQEQWYRCSSKDREAFQVSNQKLLLTFMRHEALAPNRTPPVGVWLSVIGVYHSVLWFSDSWGNNSFRNWLLWID